MKKNSLVLLLVLVTAGCFAQAQHTIIPIKNPSFEPEDYAQFFNKDAQSWVDCGFFVEEPPRIQPGSHEVELPPQHLKGYLSMVVRDNNTWDAIGQVLQRPLEAGKCYKFSIHLANAEKYVSADRKNGGRVNYRNPIRLLIWGGDRFCEAQELLAKTDLVKNNQWETYEFIFHPQATISHLALHAYYLNPMSLSYNGNILIDNASDIIEIPCPEKLPLVENEQLIELKPRSLEELENFIRLHGQQIVFTENGNELAPYQDKILYDAKDWSQIYFSVIGKSILHFPTHQLVIAVKGKSPRKIQRRIEFLQHLLIRSGVPAETYRCTPFLVDEENWLSSNKDLSFRLEPKSTLKSAKNTE